MTNEEFNRLDAEFLARCNAVFEQRGNSYGSQTDRFANFKEAAQQTSMTPLQVCHLYLLKGMSVVNKILRGETPAGETVDERFSDAVNYLRLARTMMLELKPSLLIVDEQNMVATDLRGAPIPLCTNCGHQAHAIGKCTIGQRTLILCDCIA